MSSLVLKNGPSDHQPFIQDFVYLSDIQNKFRVCTYNVNHGSDLPVLKGMFNQITKKYETSVLLLQEVKDVSATKAYFRKLGYDTRYAKPEFMVAWDKKRWNYIHHYRPQMSPTKYWTMNYALIVVLEDAKTGNRVKFMTYHPPAHVQAPHHKTFPVVSRVLREVVVKWNKIAESKRTNVDACCFAGDDNVDELKGWTPKGGWDFMLKGPLTQVRPPDPTHDRRKIDDFRVSGLTPYTL